MTQLLLPVIPRLQVVILIVRRVFFLILKESNDIPRKSSALVVSSYAASYSNERESICSRPYWSLEMAGDIMPVSRGVSARQFPLMSMKVILLKFQNMI